MIRPDKRHAKESACRVLVVIPAFNESSHLGGVLERLLQGASWDVVVVDDNSVDDTRKIAVEYGATLLPLAIRLGAWGATQTGIRYGIQNDYDIIVTMDADGQHHPSDIPSLINALQTENADVVVGSYPERGSMARHMAWKFFRMISGVKLDDLTSGLKVYSKEAAYHLAQADASIFDYQDLGVLLYLLRNKMQIIERDVRMSKREDGKSRIFNSWLLVGKYMVQTVILCLSMRRYKKKLDYQQSSGK